MAGVLEICVPQNNTIFILQDGVSDEAMIADEDIPFDLLRLLEDR